MFCRLPLMERAENSSSPGEGTLKASVLGHLGHRPMGRWPPAKRTNDFKWQGAAAAMACDAQGPHTEWQVLLHSVLLSLFLTLLPACLSQCSERGTGLFFVGRISRGVWMAGKGENEPTATRGPAHLRTGVVPTARASVGPLRGVGSPWWPSLPGKQEQAGHVPGPLTPHCISR